MGFQVDLQAAFDLFQDVAAGLLHQLVPVLPVVFRGIDHYIPVLGAFGGIGGGTQDVDLELGNVVTATVDTSATTFTFSHPPASGTAGSMTLKAYGKVPTVDIPIRVIKEGE